MIIYKNRIGKYVATKEFQKAYVEMILEVWKNGNNVNNMILNRSLRTEPFTNLELVSLTLIESLLEQGKPVYTDVMTAIDNTRIDDSLVMKHIILDKQI